MLAVSCFMNESIETKPKENKIAYPETRTVLQQDNYHGTIVDDPYRWLEDIDSEAAFMQSLIPPKEEGSQPKQEPEKDVQANSENEKSDEEKQIENGN